MTFEQLYDSLKKRDFAPVYLLHGEEEYFIDRISKYIEEQVLSEDERGFNQTVLYGRDTTADEVLETAKRFPMMSEFQVVIVKEAQQLKGMEAFESYFAQPMSTTILVLVHKHKKVDSRKKWVKAMGKNCVKFESGRMNPNQVAQWAASYLKHHNLTMSHKASVLIGDHLGSNLPRVVNELEKLILNVPAGTEVSDQHIHDYVGIHKDFNMFEFQKAIGLKQKKRAFQIATFFADNEKDFPIQMLVIILNSYFQKILTYHFTKPVDRNQDRLRTILKVPPFAVSEYRQAAANYTGKQVVRNISLLRDFDVQSKGVGTASRMSNNRLKELVLRLMA